MASENTIIGNTVLYGATEGYLFAAGRAGERFAVRNSGAQVVIEGCGSNGCEYMTGGVAVILGAIGANFGAGMTGGMAYLYDPEGQAQALMNMETLVTCPVTVEHWEAQLKGLVERHHAETGSRKAADLLQHWDSEAGAFPAGLPEGDAGPSGAPAERRGKRDPGGVINRGPLRGPFFDRRRRPIRRGGTARRARGTRRPRAAAKPERERAR